MMQLFLHYYVLSNLCNYLSWMISVFVLGLFSSDGRCLVG